MVFVHERNTWISGVFAAQGIIIIALGISAPHIIIYMSWRWVYFITAIAASFFLVGVFFFMPETRWQRSRAEMGKMNPALNLQTTLLTRLLRWNPSKRTHHNLPASNPQV